MREADRLDTVDGERGYCFSGGEKQRLAISAAGRRTRKTGANAAGYSASGAAKPPSGLAAINSPSSPPSV